MVETLFADKDLAEQQSRDGDDSPGPGVYRDVPAYVYMRWPYCSASALKALRDSPAHAIGRKAVSEAMSFGSAFDAMLLEPEQFDKNYILPGRCSGFKKAKKGAEPVQCENGGKVCRDGRWFCGVHDPGDEAGPVDARQVMEDADMARGMIDSIASHPLANHLLTSAKVKQLSIVWDDPQTGLRCKARIDMYGSYTPFGEVSSIEKGKTYSAHTDLKTCRSVDPRDFWYAANQYGYPLQTAHYREGCWELDRLKGGNQTYRRFFFLGVEKEIDIVLRGKPIYRVEVFEFDETILESATQHRAELMRQYASHVKSGNWPYRAAKLTTLGIQPPIRS